MKKNIIILLIIISILLSTTVNASVLGSVLINGYTVDIGPETTSTHNTWYSDQSGVGQQTENYTLYKPNSNVEPIITHGDYLYGASTISKEVTRIRNNGIVPLAGINADFFSLETGVPMSNIISNGKIVTKTGSPQYGIGILPDNTAFMSKFTIYTIMTKSDGSKMHIHMINKYRQPYAAYLLTNEFSSETHNTTLGYDVVLGSISGNLKLGESLTATVESITERKGSSSIPKGKMVLTVDSKAPAEYLNPIKSLKVGEKITIACSVDGDERWKKTKLGIGATGDVLIENGVKKSGFATGANPRTALGITKDGKILLYTIDGRQKGYSYGVQLKTLANRLEELGCVDAFNLDGGGSTSYIIQFPGDNVTKLVNKPSDGSLRSVSNFLFLKNNLNPTGVLKNITIYPLYVGILVNSSIQLTAKGTDTAYYPVSLNNLTYSVMSGSTSTITKDGVFTAKENGTVTVYAKSGNVTGKINIICLKTPTNMQILNSSGKAVTSLSLNPNETVNLTAKAYGGYNELTVSDGAITWSCDKNIGTITQGGKFTSATNIQATEGKIYVKAGDKTVTIPVSVKGSNIVAYNVIKLEANKTNAKITITPINNVTVNKSNITVKADGKNIDFTYSNNVVNVTLPSGTKKITVYVKNSLGYTSRATHIVSNTSSSTPLVDIKGHWAEDVISYMYSNKVISGEKTAKGMVFNPSKYMTRSEFAVMITNYLKINTSEYANVNLPYADVNKIPSWALNSFKALYKLGVITGSTENNQLYVYPTGNITRAESVTIISRTLPSGLKKANITSPDKNNIADWSKNGFEILINMGAISGYENGYIYPRRNLTKAEAVKILYQIM